MELAPLQVSFLRNWGCFDEVRGSFRAAFVGEVLVLPPTLGAVERDAVVDCLATLLDLPVDFQGPAPGGEPSPNRLYVIPHAVDDEPPPIAGSVIVCVRRRTAGTRHLDLPRAMMYLRDAVVECVGREHSGTRLQRVAAWVSAVADTPWTALRFASAAIARHLAEPNANDATVFVAGLGGVLGGFLEGIDPRVAEWLLALATRSPDAPRLVGTEAAILGREPALMRAFDLGLVHDLADEDAHAEVVNLRRALDLLGHPDEMPGAPTLASLVPNLASALPAALRPVLDRLSRPAFQPVELGVPLRPATFVGRERELARLVALCEPSHEIRTTVLEGPAGIGKTALAAALSERLGGEREPIWLSFASGIEVGWSRLATALGIDMISPASLVRGRDRLPQWARDVHERLRHRSALLVLDDVDAAVDGAVDATLVPWLPFGEGRLTILVLTRRPLPALRLERDAIVVTLAPLDQGAARELVEALLGGFGIAVGYNIASLVERLDGSPLAVRLAAALAERAGLEAVVQSLAEPVDFIPHDGFMGHIEALLRPLLKGLDADARRLLDALAVSAPEGTPVGLAYAVASLDEAAAERAFAQLPFAQLTVPPLALQAGPMAMLHPLVRLAVNRALDATPGERRALELSHAKSVVDQVNAARQQRKRRTEDALVPDLRLACEHMAARCRGGDKDAATLCSEAAESLRRYPRDDRASHIALVIDAHQATLEVWKRASSPEDWANAQVNLGWALYHLPTGDRDLHLRKAIVAFREALEVLTPESSPKAWAQAQSGLGAAFRMLPTGDPQANLQQAVAAFQASLQVLERDKQPWNWARAQSNLGAVLSDLSEISTEDREAYLHRAIGADRMALEVLTREHFPEDWARTQNNLAKALANLPRGEDDDAMLHQAIAAFRAALEVRTRDAFPGAWATVQHNLGHAFAQLTTGERDRNLRYAIDAYRAALEVRTRRAFPHDWAQTQHDLGAALAKLQSGDREANLRQAIEACEAALSVYNPEGAPHDWDAAQRLLADLRVELAAQVAAHQRPPEPPVPPS
jgi:tetratricopeptide (TPR) repeat protein